MAGAEGHLSVLLWAEGARESSLPAAGLCGAGPQGGGQRRLHPGKAQVERGVAIQAEGSASAESEGLGDQSSLK